MWYKEINSRRETILALGNKNDMAEDKLLGKLPMSLLSVYLILEVINCAIAIQRKFQASKCNIFKITANNVARAPEGALQS